jgi:uncharacterized protein with ParB-like and HNH nuclease domain
VRESALDYRDRSIDIQNINLVQFIRDLAARKFLIPTFQRTFVWNPEAVSNLWDSIYQCYPIGSILCWKTKTLLHVHRQLGGFFDPGNGDSGREIRSYILDGQQRATALLAAFYGGTRRVRERHSFDFTLYFNLVKAGFFFEKDYYRHRWDTDAAFLIPIREAPDLPLDYGRSLVGLRGFSPSVEKTLEQLRYTFTHYSIPLIVLQSYEIADVCAIYERINQNGMRLENMDILIARSFKNYAAVVEEDFPVS